MVRRITLIGNGGSGKTTLALRLGERLGLPVHHMDRIQWQPGWQPTPEAEVRDRLTEIIAGDRWIVDGLGQLWTIEMRLPRAERILFLDFPLEHCRHWAMARQREMATVARSDATEGCLLEGMDERMMDVLGRVDREMMPRIREMLSVEEVRPRVVHVTEPQALEDVEAIVFELQPR
ncbi:MAG TPA: hypothetical protein VKT78_08510 [Fimbriimonadaceae bacterium]|nr:hypothetical protein [Fimbriimonadaceae bacterium]